MYTPALTVLRGRHPLRFRSEECISRTETRSGRSVRTARAKKPASPDKRNFQLPVYPGGGKATRRTTTPARSGWLRNGSACATRPGCPAKTSGCLANWPTFISPFCCGTWRKTAGGTTTSRTTAPGSRRNVLTTARVEPFERARTPGSVCRRRNALRSITCSSASCPRWMPSLRCAARHMRWRRVPICWRPAARASSSCRLRGKRRSAAIWCGWNGRCWTLTGKRRARAGTGLSRS